MSRPFLLPINTASETRRAQWMKKNRLTRVVKRLQHKIRMANDTLKKALKNGNGKQYIVIKDNRDRNVALLQIHSAVLAVKLGQQPRSQLITPT